MKSEIKILCNNHEICPQVMLILGDMGFTNIKDVHDSSTSFDILAKHNFKDEKEEKEMIERIFHECEGKIHQVTLVRKN